MSDEYRAFRESAGAVELPRDFVHAAGPDVTSFLQGQLSQNVAVLAPGASTWALLLQPQGKVTAFLRVLPEQKFAVTLLTNGGQPRGGGRGDGRAGSRSRIPPALERRPSGRG